MKINDLMKAVLLFLGALLLVIIVYASYSIRQSWLGIPFLHGDSGSYLRPAIIKRIANEWHKGDRTMQYLYFVYYTLSDTINFNRLTFVQHLLGIFSGLALFVCFLLTNYRAALPKAVTFLMSTLLLYLYLFNPNILYYEHLIAPESFCIFLMSIFVLLISLIVANKNKVVNTFLWILIGFLNLYITNPMPKLFVSSIFIELVIVLIILNSNRPKIDKIGILILPILCYVLFVFIPENSIKIDNADEDRTNIEWKQMTYTHFDILMNDTVHLAIPPEVKISLLNYFQESKKHPYNILGFNSDELMWGKANEIIENHFQMDKTKIYGFYKESTMVLLRHNTLKLISQIFRQVFSFFLPNSLLKKEMYNSNDLRKVYEGSVLLADEFDSDLAGDFHVEQVTLEKKYFIKHLYTSNFKTSGFIDFDQLPILFRNNNSFYLFFDFLFFWTIFFFYGIRIFKKELLKFHLLYVVHAMIFCFVVTVGIVHTFDINRFVITIFPLLILSVFLAAHYIVDYIYRIVFKKYSL